GDTISTGATINSASFGTPAVGPTGLVLATVGTAAGQTMVVANPGSTPVKIARIDEASPGGGTFATFTRSTFNTSGEVAFVATVTGGPNGIFLGSTSAATAALALHGGATPAGGTY